MTRLCLSPDQYQNRFTELPATPEANSGGSAAFEGKCDGTPASVLARLANRGIWSDLSDSSLAFSVYAADERKIKCTNNVGLLYIVKLGAQHLGVEQLTASSGECNIEGARGQYYLFTTI